MAGSGPTYTFQPGSHFDFQRIRYEKSGYRATVTLNRPEVYNALDFQTLKECSVAFADAASDDAVAVVVITGAGDRAFCTGADLKEQEQFLARPQDYWKWFGAFIEKHDRLRHIGKPTLARLNGIVVGGGNELNMACDLAVAADDIYIRQVGPSRGSVPAAGATQFLPLIVGDRRAREILLLNDEITAQQALDWGLVNRVVPRAELDAAVDEYCEKLYRKMPEIVRYTRTQLNFWRDFAWSLTVEHARDWLSLHSNSAEVREGLASFHARRPIDYDAVHTRLQQAEPGQTCPKCHAGGLPTEHRFCGVCGGPLQAASS